MATTAARKRTASEKAPEAAPEPQTETVETPTGLTFKPMDTAPQSGRIITILGEDGSRQLAKWKASRRWDNKTLSWIETGYWIKADTQSTRLDEYAPFTPKAWRERQMEDDPWFRRQE